MRALDTLKRLLTADENMQENAIEKLLARQIKMRLVLALVSHFILDNSMMRSMLSCASMGGYFCYPRTVYSTWCRIPFVSNDENICCVQVRHASSH